MVVVLTMNFLSDYLDDPTIEIIYLVSNKFFDSTSSINSYLLALGLELYEGTNWFKGSSKLLNQLEAFRLGGVG